LKPYNLFLDFGATYTKAHGVSLLGDVIFQKRKKTPTLISESNLGAKSYDPIEYADHAWKFYDDIVAEFGLPVEVGVSGQVACFVIMNKDKELLTDVISWQDTSSQSPEFAEEIRRVVDRASPLEDGFRPGLPLLSIISTIRTQPEILNQPNICYLNLTNFLLSKISGQDPLSIPMHISEAHASGMFSLKKNEWLITLLPKDIGSKIIFPKVSKLPMNLSRRQSQSRFWIPIGDQQAAVHGSNLSNDQYMIHIATGGQVLCRMRSFPDSQLKSFQLRPEIQDNGVIATVTHLPAGRVFNRLFDFLSAKTGQIIDWVYLEKLDLSEFMDLDSRIDVAEINMFSADFPGLEDFSNNLDYYLLNFLHSIVGTYLDALERLPVCHHRTYIFSGGLLTKSKVLQEAFTLKLPEGAQTEIRSTDTSLAGLRRMLEETTRLA